MKNDIDILIFGGQSNMQGQTGWLPEPNCVVENVLEYRFLTDELIPLKHPVGEDVGEDLLWRAYAGHGSLIPDFCRTYIEKTKGQVVAIQVARGATMVSEWQKGTDRYACAIKKIKAGIDKAKEIGTIRHIYYIWLQGESDAINRTSEEEYINLLQAYKNDLKQDVGIEKFGIIEVGYFCCTVSWLTDRTTEDARCCDEVIMRAQEQIVELDKDFVLLTQIAKFLSQHLQYINPYEEGHYSNHGMALIGIDAAETLSKIAMDQKK